MPTTIDEILQRLAIELGHHLPFETARRVFGNVALDIEEGRPVPSDLEPWSRNAALPLVARLETTAGTSLGSVRAKALREAATTVRRLGLACDPSVMTERGVPHAAAYFIDADKLAEALEAMAADPRVGDRVRVTVAAPGVGSPKVGTEGILREINNDTFPNERYRYLVGGPDQPSMEHIGWATEVVVVVVERRPAEDSSTE
jgi:hypothetical protein